MLKESEFTFECLKNCINHSIEETGIFPSSLKLGNITPIFKKDDPLDKSNYRPVSILPLLKVYERIIYNQLSQHSEQFLNSIYYAAFVKLTITNIHFLNFSTLGKEN